MREAIAVLLTGEKKKIGVLSTLWGKYDGGNGGSSVDFARESWDTHEIYLRGHVITERCQVLTISIKSLSYIEKNYLKKGGESVIRVILFLSRKERDTCFQ